MVSELSIGKQRQRERQQRRRLAEGAGRAEMAWTEVAEVTGTMI